MILSALTDYYEQLSVDPESGISQSGYSSEKISYAVVLSCEGSVVAVDDIRETAGKKSVPRSLIVPASFKRPGIGSKPFFLWDKTSYALGIGKQKDRNAQNHEAFKERHRRELSGSDDPGLKALLAFLDAWDPESFNENPHFSAHDEQFLDSNLVFRLDGELGYLHESAGARSLYARLLEDGSKGDKSICLVTGARFKLARVHPAIKGIRGTSKAETSIVSFNKDSFTSYKKSQGENAPISVRAAEAYTAALNYLLRQKRQHMDIGDANVVFWAQAGKRTHAKAAEDLFAEFIDPKKGDDRETSKLHDALKMVRRGLPLSDLGPCLNEDTRIFVLGLSPNSSRLSIRYWETGTLRTFAERLAEHYEDLRIEPSPWRSPPALGRLLLAAAPYRGGKAKSEDVPPLLAGELTRAVLTGGRYPYSLLGVLIMRLRADREERAFGVRVALIKAILSRAKRLGFKKNNAGVPPMSLDQKNTDPGYLLGRLFSALEQVQRAALGKQINATIRDRYYGSASATPASVFPALLRNTSNHLSRLRKDKPGYAVVLERDIAEIIDLLGPAFPRSLAIEAQGHFAIGYYHQTSARFTGKDAQDENEDDQPEGDD